LFSIPSENLSCGAKARNSENNRTITGPVRKRNRRANGRTAAAKIEDEARMETDFAWISVVYSVR
jgi:hypothetical protein